MDELKKYLTYFDDSQIRLFNLDKLDGIILFKGNDTSVKGHNINNLNTYYCELCTLYYVWKNKLYSPYVEFVQYRRPFNYEGDMPKIGECITYRPIMLNIGIYMQFVMCHVKKRIDDIISVLDGMYGYGNKYSNYMQYGVTLYTNNTFIMQWDDFCQMCDFVFGVLFEYDKVLGLGFDSDKYDINSDEYSKGNPRPDYQKHFMAYLGERLVSAWISLNMKDIPVERNKQMFFQPFETEK